MSLALLQPPAYELAQTPSYAVLPRTGEQRLALSGRMPSRAIRSGTISRRSKRLVLALYEQRAEGDVPVFDRGGWATGCVGLLERAQEVQKLEIKVEGSMLGQGGRVGSMPSPGNSRSINDTKKVTFMNEVITLWKKSPAEPTCPTEIPFRFRLPKTFLDNEGNEWLLPPTFENIFKGVFGFVAYCRCTISVIATFPRTLDMLRSKDSELCVPFMLQARTRPPYASGIDVSSRLMDTLKTAPEAWSQHNFSMSTTGPIGGQLYIPKPEAYCMLDPIPFHLQLMGEPESLSFFQSSRTGTSRGEVQVTLLRHVVIHTGEGDVVNRIPAGRANIHVIHEDKGLISWEGELIVDANIAVGGFHVGPITMNDFIAVSVEPPPLKNAARIAFIQSQRRIKIMLTTDRWQDMGEAGPYYGF